MKYQVVEKGSNRYIEVVSSETPVKTGQDALELAELCGEAKTDRLMIHREALPEDFFRLRSGVAGAVLQKFITYSLKTAIILPD